ncbi:hypothetical protein TCON_1627 [Astathelohania contejeani]|uniref:Uncharacterized protein n=1 Tax=Astathelohania contejeani TaxID=164912 RepID=A0ABQ7HYF1_9MICR|nr:hypothetical protein TCON_1627 [Thelohania contejeani]
MNELDMIPFELVNNEGLLLTLNLKDFDINNFHLVLKKNHQLHSNKKYIQSFIHKESAFVAAITLAFIKYGKERGFKLTISNIIHEALLKPDWGMSNTIPLEIYWHRDYPGEVSSTNISFTSNSSHYILNRFCQRPKIKKKCPVNIINSKIFSFIIVLILSFIFYVYIFNDPKFFMTVDNRPTDRQGNLI